MNSVLQSLFILDEFKDRYYKDGLKHLETCTNYTPECFICQMSKIGYGLYSGDYSQKINPEPMQLEGQTGELDLEVLLNKNSNERINLFSLIKMVLGPTCLKCLLVKDILNSQLKDNKTPLNI